jgi:hypothetical protein
MSRLGFLSTVAFGFAFLLLAGCHVSNHRRHPAPVPGPHVSHRPGPPAHANAHGRRRYRYYHDSEVYFDIQTNHWFWISAGTWRSGPSLPRTYKLNRSASVVVEMETNKPYTRHTHFKAKHPRKGHAVGKAPIRITPGKISGKGPAKITPGKVSGKGPIKVTPGKAKPPGKIKVTPAKSKGPVKVTPGKIKLPSPGKAKPKGPPSGKSPSKGKGNSGKGKGKKK